MAFHSAALSLTSVCVCSVAVSVACSPSSGSKQSSGTGHQRSLEIEEADPEVLQFGDAGDGSGLGSSGEAEGLLGGDSYPDTPSLGDGDGYTAAGTGGAPSSGGTTGYGGELPALGGAPSEVGPESLEDVRFPLALPPAIALVPPQESATALTAGIWDDNRSFDFFRLYQEYVHESQQGLMPFDLERDYLPVREEYVDAQRSHERLDISIVLDTTGSMGDEIAYLQNEFLGISALIGERYPTADQRWSLIVYRDYGQEEYLTRTTPFSSDLQSFQGALSRQVADGGGDFPEAPDAALAEASVLDWRLDEDVARLVFWVADAPHHAEYANAMADAVRAAQRKNLHIYPVGASGLDEFTEFTMRQAAQMTMGRYIFLTDDSGVGGAHREPTLPCYYVTSLRDALLRGIDAEMTGEYRLPDPSSVIRQGGNFTFSGVCGYGTRSETMAF